MFCKGHLIALPLAAVYSSTAMASPLIVKMFDALLSALSMHFVLQLFFALPLVWTFFQVERLHVAALSRVGGFEHRQAGSQAVSQRPGSRPASQRASRSVGQAGRQSASQPVSRLASESISE